MSDIDAELRAVERDRRHETWQAQFSPRGVRGGFPRLDVELGVGFQFCPVPIRDVCAFSDLVEELRHRLGAGFPAAVGMKPVHLMACPFGDRHAIEKLSRAPVYKSRKHPSFVGERPRSMNRHERAELRRLNAMIDSYGEPAVQFTWVTGSWDEQTRYTWLIDGTGALFQLTKYPDNSNGIFRTFLRSSEADRPAFARWAAELLNSPR